MVKKSQLQAIVKTIVKDGYKEKEGKLYFTEPYEIKERIVAGRDASVWSEWRKENLKYFEEKLKNKPRNVMLVDVGAGPSQFYGLFSQFTLISIDFSPYPDIDIVADITESIPLKDAVCDIVILSNTLEHLKDPMATLRECHRILKRGGLLVGTVPFLMQTHQEPYDFHRYTNFMLEYMLVQNGFFDVEVKPLGNTFNVWQTMTEKFLTHFIDSSKNPFFVFFARVTRKIIIRSFIKLFRPFLRQARTSYRFTEGYGFFAQK
ncbi:MAG: class I SAM-dependent methyltransferase [Candidatus Liptonbacteria bacterium]|nr:class I SAM-dependent methyltransferase [Candidatus Liptonbacteria bacterium]